MKKNVKEKQYILELTDKHIKTITSACKCMINICNWNVTELIYKCNPNMAMSIDDTIYLNNIYTNSDKKFAIKIKSSAEFTLKNIKLETILTEEQASYLSFICENIARLYMGQIENLHFIYEKAPYLDNDYYYWKQKLFPKLSRGAYYGIHCKEASDTARQLFDIYQVVRYTISWANADNTPETRRWPEQITVNFDTPYKTSTKLNLIKMKELK